jgi:hypothetical protein
MSHRPLTNTSRLKITAAYCTGLSKEDNFGLPGSGSSDPFESESGSRSETLHYGHSRQPTSTYAKQSYSCSIPTLSRTPAPMDSIPTISIASAAMDSLPTLSRAAGAIDSLPSLCYEELQTLLTEFLR